MDKEKIKGTSFNTKKIKIEEMHNLIDKILSLNDIFQTSFNAYILFEESDKNEYKQLINYLFLKFDMNSTKMVLSKDFKIILSYKLFQVYTRCYCHKDVLKLIAFLIYFLNVAYFFQTSSIKFLQYFDVLFKILAKLFKDKIVNELDICFFIKYFMVLSTFNTNEAFRVGKSIKKMIVFWLALNFFTSFFKDHIINNKIHLINDMISFIDTTFLVNNLNIIILSKSTQFLGLLDIIKTDNDPNSYINLFQLISKIYSIQYNLKQHRTIISIINNELSGPKFYTNLAVNSKFLNIMSLSLNNILPIKNGFFFTNQPNSGLRISPIISFPNKGYTFIFSFKCISSNDLPEQTILCLKEQISNNREKEIKEVEFYKISIKNNILNIQIHNDTFSISNFPLKKDQFYIVVIVQNEQSFFGGSKSKLSVIFNNLKDIFQKEMTYPKGKMIKGTIGFYESRQRSSDIKNEKEKIEKDIKVERERFKIFERFHFYGIFGSFFIFEEVFNNELLTKLFDLGEDYELLLYRNYHFLNSYDAKKIKIVKAIGQIENVKIESKLICLVSPKAVFESLLKSNNLIREDYGDFNISNLAVSRRKFEILTNTCIFNVFKFHSNFSNFEGIPYLCYILKCINNQLMNDKGSLTFSQIDTIWSIIISIIEIAFIIILNDTQIGANHRNIIYLFFHYLSGIIEKVTVTKTIPIAIFENMIKYLYLFDNFSEQSELVFYLKIKYCELIFDDRLYDTSDHNIISNLLFSFLRYIETVQTNLISVKTFTKLLNFSKSIFGSDQTQMKKDLKNQISDTIKVMISLNKKFIYISFSEKKIKLILELLNFAIDSRYHNYRCYKLVKIFYMVYSEKEKFQKEFLTELIKMRRHESFIMKFYYLLNFYNKEVDKYEPPYVERLCALCIRIIDIFYFKQSDKIISNFTLYKESQKSRFTLFSSIVDQMHPIQTTYLTKSLILTIFEKKEINPLEEFKVIMDDKNIQLMNLQSQQNDICFIAEPMKIIINNLDKFNNVDCLNCIVKNFSQIFYNISMKVSKPYYSKTEKESTSFQVLTRKHICERFFDFVIFRENLSQNWEIKKTLSNIIKASISTHSKPFYFNVNISLIKFLYNLYIEKYNNVFFNDTLNEILNYLNIYLKKEPDSRAINYNIINLMFLLYKMMIYSINKYIYFEILKSEQFFKFYFEFVSLIFQSQIVYYYNKLFKIPGEKDFKTLFEIYFDLNFYLYTITKEEKVLKLFEQIFFIKPGNFVNKSKGETIPTSLDKYFRLNRAVKINNVDFKKLKYYDSIFFEERENKINFISMEFLTKFIVLYYFFSDKKEFLKKHNSQKEFLMSPKKDFSKTHKIMHSNLLDQEPYDFLLFCKDNNNPIFECKMDIKQIEFLQNIIITSCKDIINLFYRSDIFPGNYNLGNNKNIDINNFTQLITNEMFNYFEKNKNCFPISNPIIHETDKEEFNKIIIYFFEVIKYSTVLYEKYLESNYLKKREELTPREMNQVKTPIFGNYDQDLPQKLNSSELCFPQFDDDKIIDEIENNLNIILYNTNKSLDKINLAIFFKEKFISDDIYTNILNTGFKDLIKKQNSDILLTKTDFRKDVYIKVKNHFIIGNSYFRPFVKPIVNYSHSKYFEITHSHLNYKLEELRNVQVKQELKINFNIKSEIIYQQYSENITNEGVYIGSFSITNKYVLFESNNFKTLNSEDKHEYLFGSLDTDLIYERKIIVIDYTEIKEILVRRFLLMWQAFEIFLNNGKSYFFNFYKIDKCQNAFAIFKKIKKENKFNFLVIKNSGNYFKKVNFTKKWLDGELSNFDYLCILNKYSGRTYQDMNQYPVFPWVLAEYKTSSLNLEDKKFFRNLAFPVSIQSETKRKYIMQKYESENDNQVHFRCHYATSPIVSLYLLRLQPFTNCSIKLQNNKFDNADRIFYNMGDTYSVLENLSDNRELTPEFFYCPEFLVNKYFKRKRSDNKLVNNIQLPDWASNPVDFIHKHRLALESYNVTENLHLWIDNIFGFNQLIRNKESLNVFPDYTYEQETKLDKLLEAFITKNTDVETIHNEIKNIKDIIINFGQTPHKLFEEKHPKKQNQTSNKEELLSVIEILSKKKTSNIFFFQKGVKYFNFSKNYYYIITTFKEVDIFDKNFKKKSKVRLKVQEKLSVLRKKILNTNSKIHINKEKFRIIELKDCKYFVSCGHLDQSIKIYTNENIHDYQLNSIVTSLLKTNDETILYTGHINGKLSIWSLIFQQNSTLSLSLKKEFVNHDDAINCILHYERLGLLVTGSDDGTVTIRNLFNYEIINFINPKIDLNDNKRYKIIDIKISEFNWIYILAYESENFFLFGYTLSGIKFSLHTGLINNFEFTPLLGNLIVGYYDNRISVLYATDLKPIYTKSLDEIHDFFLYYFCLSNEYHKPFYLGYGDGNFWRYYIEDDKEKKFFD